MLFEITVVKEASGNLLGKYPEEVNGAQGQSKAT